MNKSAKSLYTAITGLMFNILSGIIGLFVTRLVISNYGSDFNGINSTANQLINMLLVVEGGFTLAISVSLFKPISDNNYNIVNEILSAAKKIFNKIGVSFLIVGIVVSFLYSILIKSNLPSEIAFLTFFMAVFSSAFNLFYAMKYRILLQTEQKEYILNSISTITLVVTQSIILLSIYLNGNMLNVRLFTMLGAITNSILIAYISKLKYSFINFNETPKYDSIKGTKDVLIQKITSMIYTSVPMVFISASIGTVYASVYAVYNSVFMLLKNIMYSLISAPRMGFGNLIAQREKNYVYKIFLQYEMIVNTALLLILSVASVLIIPFIKVYTFGVSDTNYINWNLALLLILITFFEIIHVPSGNIINMSGNFKIAKTFQTIASILLMILMFIGNYIFGFYGILLSVLITAIILAVLEIFYVHKMHFERRIRDFFKLLIPQTVLIICLIILEMKILPNIENYFEFVFYGCLLFLFNFIFLLIYYYLFNRATLFEVMFKIKTITRK